MDGPFTFDELKSLDTNPSTKIWYKELKEWTEIASTPVFQLIFDNCKESTETQDAPVSHTEIPYRNEEIPEEQDSAEYTGKETPINLPPVFNRDEYMSQKYQTPQTQPHINPQEAFENAFIQGYHKGLEEGKQLGKETDTSKCPPTNLVWAILSTILCCLPIGVVAIVYASKVSNHFYNNNYLKAKKASDRALYWSLASMIVWMVTQPILSALSLLFGSI